MLPLVMAGLLLLAPAQDPQGSSLAEQAAAVRKARQQKTAQSAADTAKNVSAPTPKRVLDNDALAAPAAAPASSGAGDLQLTPYQQQQLDAFSRELQSSRGLFARSSPVMLARMRDNLQRELEDVRARELQAGSPQEKNKLAAEALFLERKLQILHRKMAGTR